MDKETAGMNVQERRGRRVRGWVAWSEGCTLNSRPDSSSTHTSHQASYNKCCHQDTSSHHHRWHRALQPTAGLASLRRQPCPLTVAGASPARALPSPHQSIACAPCRTGCGLGSSAVCHYSTQPVSHTSFALVKHPILVAFLRSRKLSLNPLWIQSCKICPPSPPPPPCLHIPLKTCTLQPSWRDIFIHKVLLLTIRKAWFVWTVYVVIKLRGCSCLISSRYLLYKTIWWHCTLPSLSLKYTSTHTQFLLFCSLSLVSSPLMCGLAIAPFYPLSINFVTYHIHVFHL